MPPIAFAVWASLLASQPVPDFELRDPTGTPIRLSTYAPNRPVVLAFLGAECPVASLYAARLAELSRRPETQGARFLAIDSLPQDGLTELAKFAHDHRLPFPIVTDPDGRIAAACGAVRVSQVVVLDAGRRVRYRGRIDDQYEPGGRGRVAPTRADLAEALTELLAGRSVSVPETKAFGCIIPRPRPLRADCITSYYRDIAPILRAHCEVCHRAGEAAPFALQTYDDARHWAAMIVEVTSSGYMPPWSANPKHGRFRNERRLTDKQKELLACWSQEGCPEGSTADAPAPVRWPSGWAIGTPDLVLKMPTPFRVPAEGLIEYQHVILDPGASTDLWVTAAEFRPGNRRVVHHCNVYLHPPEAGASTTTYETTGLLGSVCMLAYTPGTEPLKLPAGTAIRIPAGYKLHLVLHYTAIGVSTEDTSELGLVLADQATIHQEVAVKAVNNKSLCIPAGAAAYRIEDSWRAEADYMLLSMLPHMHLRGKSFRYSAEYPDGSSEVLLDVPAYDFNWQHRYVLAEPKRIPAGTVIRCRGEYDNSAANPVNPDPTVEVRYGYQSQDEMFVGYFEVVLADVDLQAAKPRHSNVRLAVLGSVLLVIASFLGWRRWRARTSASA